MTTPVCSGTLKELSHTSKPLYSLSGTKYSLRTVSSVHCRHVVLLVVQQFIESLAVIQHGVCVHVVTTVVSLSVQFTLTTDHLACITPAVYYTAVQTV